MCKRGMTAGVHMRIDTHGFYPPTATAFAAT
jgi:hypothetical protein